MTVIAARAAVVDGSLVGPTEVVVDSGGLIEEVRSIADRAGLIDGVLVPGFIDLQVNGVDDVDVATADGKDWDRLDSLLLDQGTTTWLPTLVSGPLHRYEAALDRIGSAGERSGGGQPTMAGVHLEGPFLGGARGAHPERFVIDIDLPWLAALPPHVRLLTLGPEQPLAPAAIAALTARGITVSLGHSRADETETLAAIAAGARMVTHLFNAMGALHHRSPGLAAVALTDDRLTVGLIADGVHVHPRMISLAVRACGPRRIALVTDAVAWRAGAAGEVRMSLVEGAPRLADGTLAGSALTMDAAVRFVVHHCGVSLADAVTMASNTPARVIGLADRGVIASGQRADLVILDEGLRRREVWLGGLNAR